MLTLPTIDQPTAATRRKSTGDKLFQSGHIVRNAAGEPIASITEERKGLRVKLVNSAYGFKPDESLAGNLVTELIAGGDANTKTRKNKGYESGGLSLAAARMCGVGNVCTFASTGCTKVCVGLQGHGYRESVQYPRICKTLLWQVPRFRDRFCDMFTADVERLQRRADRNGKPLAIRPNMFSDIQWERYGLLQQFPNVQWYDYTKDHRRVGQVLPNYWTTFSRSETNEQAAVDVLASGGNVAVVFYSVGNYCGKAAAKQNLPATWYGHEVVSGNESDLRFDDPRGGYVIGLNLKARTLDSRQEAIDSGFAVHSLGCL